MNYEQGKDMRLPKGKLKLVANKTQLSTQKVCDYAATRQRPSRKRAIHLEKETGIPASLWLLGTSDQIKLAIMNVANNEHEI